MSLNLNTIKSKLEQLTCSVHGKHPIIKVVDSNLNFECCCENFRTKCLNESKKTFGDEIQKSLTETFNKAFKKLR